jgi:formiminotetrahydrofolate cyclodeaminase
MEEALGAACAVPLEIMEKCGEALGLLGEFAAKGNRLALSDAGAGAAFCGAALAGASLNVFINTAAMKDRDRAEELNRRAEALLAEYAGAAERIFTAVKEGLRWP